MFCVLVVQTGHLEPLLNKFTAEEERQMKRMLQRVDVLAKVRIPKQIKVHLVKDFKKQYKNLNPIYCNKMHGSRKSKQPELAFAVCLAH